MNAKEIENHLRPMLPPASAGLVADLWKKDPFSIKITRNRLSKFGDFSYKPAQGAMISLNSTLEPMQFLLTLIHEIAHWHCFRKYGSKRKKIAPHGMEWKRTFQQLMVPFLNHDHFSETALPLVKNYMENPKASSAQNAPLFKALNPHQSSPENMKEVGLFEVGQLTIGDYFIYRKHAYRLDRHLDKNTLAHRVTDQRNYKFNKGAFVQHIKEEKQREAFELLDQQAKNLQAEASADRITVGEIPIGSDFRYQKIRYRKLKDNRTRSVVQQVGTSNHFTFPMEAEVEKIA
ncbi:SprT-like domain-containing protein [Persicobacter psychrovividus]|uniref:SprT-like domain-containing protein n=1 Tax=Persicobacter psychrovividus TaxID=387638 RepID=A0ABM7VFR7_9BACT|nr:hypothetical protein PEPS_20910 [Persicobacter psychrovividus]